LLVHLTFSRQLRAALLVAGLTVIGLLPQTWLNASTSGGVVSAQYQTQVFDHFFSLQKLTQVAANVSLYTGYAISHQLAPVFGPGATAALARLGLPHALPLLNALLLTALGVGFVHVLRQRRLSELYVVGYSAALLSWGHTGASSCPRYLIPITPFL